MLTVLHDTVSYGLWINVKKMRNTICSSEVCRQEERWSYFIFPSVNTILLVSILGSSPQPSLWRSGCRLVLVIAVLDWVQGPSFQYPVWADGGNRGSRKLQSSQSASHSSRIHMSDTMWGSDLLLSGYLFVGSVGQVWCYCFVRENVDHKLTFAVQFLAVAVLASFTPWWFGFFTCTCLLVQGFLKA